MKKLELTVYELGSNEEKFAEYLLHDIGEIVDFEKKILKTNRFDELLDLLQHFGQLIVVDAKKKDEKMNSDDLGEIVNRRVNKYHELISVLEELSATTKRQLEMFRKMRIAIDVYNGPANIGQYEEETVNEGN